MTDQKDKPNLGKMLLTTKLKKENRCLFLDKPVPDLWLYFCRNFLASCCLSWVAFGEFTFRNVMTNELFRWEFCVVQKDTFYYH